jgi:hypothetical protein
MSYLGDPDLWGQPSHMRDLAGHGPLPVKLGRGVHARLCGLGEARQGGRLS